MSQAYAREAVFDVKSRYVSVSSMRLSVGNCRRPAAAMSRGVRLQAFQDRGDDDVVVSHTRR